LEIYTTKKAIYKQSYNEDSAQRLKIDKKAKKDEFDGQTQAFTNVVGISPSFQI